MHACAPRFPSAYWQEEEDGSALSGLGRYSARTRRPAQVTLSLYFISVFYFSLSFDLVLKLNHFCCFCKLLYGLEILL